jgi:DNA-binding Lrp family transcriptional regulator
VLGPVRAEVSPAALGYPITAMILVNAEQHAWEQVRGQLVTLPGFEYLAVTSGELDFFVIVHVADVAALRDVVLRRVHRIQGVRTTRTVFVLEEERHPVGLEAPGGAHT